MQVGYERCAGLDVHKKNGVVCASTPDAQGSRHKEWRTFSTMTPALLRMRDWLKEREISHGALERTASFWKPIFNILEGHLEVLVVNAQHLKAVPGRQTDTTDAEWIAALRASWAPATEFCACCRSTRAARAHPLPYELGGRALAQHQSAAEDVGGYEYQVSLRRK